MDVYSAVGHGSSEVMPKSKALPLTQKQGRLMRKSQCVRRYAKGFTAPEWVSLD